MNTVAERIKYARKQAKLTQQALAEACGIKRASVTQWESGSTKSLKPENLFAVAKATNIDAKWLATGKGTTQPQPQPQESGTTNTVIHGSRLESAQATGFLSHSQAQLLQKLQELIDTNMLTDSMAAAIEKMLDAMIEATSPKNHHQPETNSAAFHKLKKEFEEQKRELQNDSAGENRTR